VSDNDEVGRELGRNSPKQRGVLIKIGTTKSNHMPKGDKRATKGSSDGRPARSEG
jgi:hypothetical protein